VKRHDLTGRGVESDPDPAECFKHACDKAQVIDNVTVGRRKWPTSSHPYQGKGNVLLFLQQVKTNSMLAMCSVAPGSGDS
jgi:hypothetical protein